MRNRFLPVGAVLALTAAVVAAAPAQAIVGGTESARAYPFVGSFQPSFPAPPRADGHGCGVEVLAPQWVLTASHCAGKNPTGAKTGVPRGWRVRIVVRAPASRPKDPALLLTNGHCVQGQRPAPGTALVDQPADRAVPIADRQGYPQATARANRLLYATMTGTDIALYRLDKTYAQLTAEGAKIFRLTTVPVRAGDVLTMAATSSRPHCTAEAIVTHLREGGYQQDDSIRYATNDGCVPWHGTSGSALLAPDGTTVVGIHNTHNDAGEQCTDDNPCEVGPDGVVTSVRGRGYGQQVHQLAACLATGSRLDLSKADCTLPAGRR